MNISFSTIGEGIQTAYKAAAESVGYLAGRAVRLVDFASSHVQDPRIAATVLILGNIGIFELAIQTSRSVAEVLNRISTHYEKLNDRQRSVRAGALFIVFTATIVGTNYAVYRALRLPLNPFAAMGISLAANTAYFFIRTGNFTRY